MILAPVTTARRQSRAKARRAARRNAAQRRRELEPLRHRLKDASGTWPSWACAKRRSSAPRRSDNLPSQWHGTRDLLREQAGLNAALGEPKRGGSKRRMKSKSQKRPIKTCAWRFRV